jgi:hypothetical protein
LYPGAVVRAVVRMEAFHPRPRNIRKFPGSKVSHVFTARREVHLSGDKVSQFVPYPLPEFYMKEYGLGAIGIRRFSPAAEAWPEIAELPESSANDFSAVPVMQLSGASCKIEISASLGDRSTVGLQILDLRIGVRIPVSQPTTSASGRPDSVPPRRVPASRPGTAPASARLRHSAPQRSSSL